MKKLDKISDFVAAWKVYDSTSGTAITSTTWDRRFREAGYFKIEKNRRCQDLNPMIEWLYTNVDRENCIYLSLRETTNFYFQSEKDAVLFALKW